jgi:hypothetical protein
MVLDYIATYKEVAKNNMRKYGIPSSIILGQGILESGAGTGPLSVLANGLIDANAYESYEYVLKMRIDRLKLSAVIELDKQITESRKVTIIEEPIVNKKPVLKKST